MKTLVLSIVALTVIKTSVLCAMDQKEIAQRVQALLEIENKRNAQRWAQPSQKKPFVEPIGSKSDEGKKAVPSQSAMHKRGSLNQPFTIKSKPIIKTFVAGSNKQEMVIVQE